MEISLIKSTDNSRFDHPNTIRGRFGLSDTRNSSHGSDSDETARREIKFFFPDFDQNKFVTDSIDKEKRYKLDGEKFVHTPVN